MLRNKIILSIIVFLILHFSLFAEEAITYEVITKSDVYSYPSIYCYNKAKNIGDKIIVNYPPTINFLSFPDNDIQIQCLFYDENNQSYAIPLRNIKILDSEELPHKNINYDSTGLIRKVIPAYYLDVLASQDSQKILNYEKTYARYVAKNNQTAALGRRIQNWPDEFSAIISSIYILLNSGDEIYFRHIKKISDSVYECDVTCHEGYTSENHDYSDNFWQICLNMTSVGHTEVMRITIDGDYLNIDIINNSSENIINLTYVDDSVINSLEDLFIEGKSDLSRVTWPRHADGSCDYDNSSTAKKVSFSSTNVAPNKQMTVTENLKLRSGEATTTSVLTVMSAGTKVKILELGKAETIDGINSNWVKVEVISGKDRDGKEIKKKTTGWCYGGYLK